MTNEKLPIAYDPKSKMTLEIARKAAKSNATILITGETGVGKEIIARYIHHHSLLSHGPFVSVNCAALPHNMFESLLFGYEKGAFTGAANSFMGKFEQAHNGTLLLDEISEIPLELQAKLLRVLQEREIERLGGKKAIKIHVRVIAATNRNLQQQVTSGYFRSDLFYRLNVIPIHCAPLRDRVFDIIPLAEYFVEFHANTLGIKTPIMTTAAKDKLVNYRWPGNIREMDNVIQHAVIMKEGEKIDADDISLIDTFSGVQSQSVQISTLKANEAKIIMEVLKETEGCRGTAAKVLNMSPRTLRYKISKLKSIGIKIPEKADRE
ncbi:MAG: sigma-54 interaction domain-containing protein [Gammaproteobacteria bacterium]